MDFDKLRAGVEEISVSDGFVVDIEGFSHLTERDTNANSRIFSINHSRKGSTRGTAEKKINPTAAAPAATAIESSSRATLPLIVVASDYVANPKIHHHQITVKKGSLNSPSGETKHGGKRFRHRHSPQGRFLDPRKVLVFFATLSSMGTVLLIYFTLSMGKLNGDDNSLN